MSDEPRLGLVCPAALILLQTRRCLSMPIAGRRLLLRLRPRAVNLPQERQPFDDFTRAGRRERNLEERQHEFKWRWDQARTEGPQEPVHLQGVL